MDAPVLRAKTAAGERLLPLDGVRGIAVLMIVLLHGRLYFTPENLFDRVFVNIIESLWWGVDLFFVLSGFLITQILRRSKDHPNYKAFYARRFLRIIPAYYTLLILFGIGRMIGGYMDQPFGGQGLMYFSYVQNFIMFMDKPFVPAILNIAWSLAIEMQFYFVWPFLIYRASDENARLICLAGLLMGALVRFGFHFTETPIAYCYGFTLTHMDGLIVGSLIALLFQEEHWRERLRRWNLPVIAASLTAVALCEILEKSPDPRTTLTVLFGYPALALASGGIVVRALTSEENSLEYRFLTNRTLRVFATYSYAIYLFHRVAARGVFYIFFRAEENQGRVFPLIFNSQVPMQLLFYVPVIAGSLAAGWLSWHLVEKHFQKLNKRFPMRG